MAWTCVYGFRNLTTKYIDFDITADICGTSALRLGTESANSGTRSALDIDYDVTRYSMPGITRGRDARGSLWET